MRMATGTVTREWCSECNNLAWCALIDTLWLCQGCILELLESLDPEHAPILCWCYPIVEKHNKEVIEPEEGD